MVFLANFVQNIAPYIAAQGEQDDQKKFIFGRFFVPFMHFVLFRS